MARFYPGQYVTVVQPDTSHWGTDPKWESAMRPYVGSVFKVLGENVLGNYQMHHLPEYAPHFHESWLVLVADPGNWLEPF